MGIRAGFAEIDITPPLGTHKIGWLRDLIADTVLDPLYARVCVMESEDDVLACTTCHLAHGSPNPDLLRWSQEEFVSACTTCHATGARPSAGADLMARDRSQR